MHTRINATTTTMKQNSTTSSSNTTIEIQLYPDQNCRSNSTFFTKIVYFLHNHSANTWSYYIYICNLWLWYDIFTLNSHAHTHTGQIRWMNKLHLKQHQCRTNKVEKPVSIIIIIHTHTLCILCAAKILLQQQIRRVTFIEITVIYRIERIV